MSGTIALDDIDLDDFPAASHRRAAAQRSLDLVVGGALAILFAPLALIIACLLAWKVDGSLLLREQRVGRDGRVFEVLRFRTTTHGTIGPSGLARLIWCARMDELPQIINVLRGDMSIVGPRPETPEKDTWLSAQLRGYALRHRVKPGLTGWAQAMGQWSGGDEPSRLTYDLFYVRHRSVWIDLRVILRTAAMFLSGAAGR